MPTTSWHGAVRSGAAPVKVLVVTGIYPPDIGGPATHADDVRRSLSERGHQVTVLSLTDAPRSVHSEGVVRFPRSWPWPVRAGASVGWLATRGRRYDVIYATGLGPIAVAGARLARRPSALKIVGDPAWERGVRRGLTARDFDEFQREAGGGLALRGMLAVRDWSVRHATAVLAPSPQLAALAGRWARRNDVRVVPNGVRAPEPSDRQRSAGGPLQLVFVGRLVSHKHLELIIDAVRQSPATRLDVVGDGPELDTWRALAERSGLSGRVRFEGALGHDETLHRIGRADALVLASGYEGLPHVVLEALACGTPVVTTARHGLDAVLTDGVDSLLVDDDATAFAAAFDRLAGDESLRLALNDGARATGRGWTLDHCVDQLEQLFEELARAPRRAVFLGKTDMPRPPTHDDEEKYRINGRHVSSYVVCTGRPAGLRRPAGASAFALPRLRPAPLGSVLFYAGGPLLALGAGVRRSRGRDRVPEPVRSLWRRAPPVCGAPGSSTSAPDRGARRLANRVTALRRTAPLGRGTGRRSRRGVDASPRGSRPCRE